MTIHHSNAFFQFSIFFSSLIIVSKSSGLISLFINALDILVSMLFNLHLASITILLCFFSFYFFLFLKNFFTNPDVTESVKPQLAPIILVGAPITIANDSIEILPDNIDKAFNVLSE